MTDPTEAPPVSPLVIRSGIFEFTVDPNFEGSVRVVNLQIKKDGDAHGGYLGDIEVDALLDLLGHYLAHKSHAAFVARANTVARAVQSKPQAFVEALVEAMIK